LIDKYDYIGAKKLLKSAVIKYNKQNKQDKRKLPNCYFLLARVLRYLKDYENAKLYILKAMEESKNNYNCYAEYAEILFKLNKNEKAEIYYKKALNICITKKGKTHRSTAITMYNYGRFLVSLGRIGIAKQKLNKAYSIYIKAVGKENLNTARMNGDISNLYNNEKKYAEAYEKAKTAFIGFKNIFGNNNKETLICKNNCARVLIKMRKYSEAIDFMDSPLVLIDKEISKLVLVSYAPIIMKAPEIYIIKTGSSVLKFIKTMENKNVPIYERGILVRAIISDSNYYFEPILELYYETVALIFSKFYIYKKETDILEKRKIPPTANDS